MRYPEYPDDVTDYKMVRDFLKACLQHNDAERWNDFREQLRDDPNRFNSRGFVLSSGDETRNFDLYIPGLNVRAVDFEGFDLSDIAFHNLVIKDSNVVGVDLSNSYIGKPLDGTYHDSNLTGSPPGHNSWINNNFAYVDMDGLIVQDLHVKSNWIDLSSVVLEQASFEALGTRHQVTGNYDTYCRLPEGMGPGEFTKIYDTIKDESNTLGEVVFRLEEDHGVFFEGDNAALITLAMQHRDEVEISTLPAPDPTDSLRDPEVQGRMHAKREKYNENHAGEPLRWHDAKPAPSEAEPEPTQLSDIKPSPTPGDAMPDKSIVPDFP